MLEQASKVTQRGRFHYVEYARFADDLVVLREDVLLQEAQLLVLMVAIVAMGMGEVLVN